MDIVEFDGLVGYLDRRLTEAERKNLAEKGVYCYETRHADNGDMATPVTIENRVRVNFCNTIVTSKPLPLPEGGHIDIEWDEENIEETEVKKLLNKP